MADRKNTRSNQRYQLYIIIIIVIIIIITIIIIINTFPLYVFVVVPAGVFGDPHLMALDGTSTSFQRTGDFSLLTTAPGLGGAHLQGQFAALGGW